MIACHYKYKAINSESTPLIHLYCVDRVHRATICTRKPWDLDLVTVLEVMASQNERDLWTIVHHKLSMKPGFYVQVMKSAINLTLHICFDAEST